MSRKKWDRVGAEEVKVNTNINGVDVMVYFKSDKEAEAEETIDKFQSEIDLMNEFKGGYDQSVQDIKALDEREKKLAEELKKIREDRKRQKENSIVCKNAHDDTKSKVVEMFTANSKGLFKGTSLKELKIDTKLPTVKNIIGKKGNLGKYEDSMKAEWSKIMREEGFTKQQALEAINARYAHKTDLNGDPIHFNTTSSLRGVVEPWEIKMGILTRTPRPSARKGKNNKKK